jgi:uncharacterized membrane protein
MKLNPLPEVQEALNLPSNRSLKRFGRLLLDTLINLNSRLRIGVAVMFGMLIFLLLPDSMRLDSRILAAWISGVLFFLAVVVLMMSHADPTKTCYRAQRQEAQHRAIFLLVVFTALTSIFAIGLMLANNKSTPAPLLAVQVGLSVVAILCSWFLTHTMFALHYATCYYRRDYSAYNSDDLNPTEQYMGGIALPEEEPPDYLDFMYFSFTIGMTSQTSDISITNRSMRRLATGHGIVSFFFYSIIIALSVGVVGGLI